MNEFIITVKEEITKERYATKEEIILCKKSILRDKIDKMIKFREQVYSTLLLRRSVIDDEDNFDVPDALKPDEKR